MLTEAIYLDDNDEVVTDNIRRLMDLGIEIEIDDFGTGYASIVSLMRLKPDRLKIAHQLTATVSQSQAQRQLIRSIVEIGRAHGIGIVAEVRRDHGTGRHPERSRLRYAAGLAFGRPMDADSLVRSWTPTPSCRANTSAAPAVIPPCSAPSSSERRLPSRPFGLRRFRSAVHRGVAVPHGKLNLPLEALRRTLIPCHVTSSDHDSQQ